MWDMTPAKILVAVESADCDAALGLAAAEARKRHCGVHLIHVNQPTYGGAGALDTMVVVTGQLQRVGAMVLADASAKLEHLLIDDDLTVSTELCHGAVVPTLVAESIHACVVIMQHRGVAPEGDLRVMSIVHGVATRAYVPVIAVPSTWRPRAEAVPVISVGVEDVSTSAQVVRVALEEADRSDARLRLVHAHPPLRTGDATLDHMATHRESLRIKGQLAAQYADLLGGFPGVATDIVVATGSPTEVLLDQAQHSAMLVVGRRHPGLPTVSHLGPVARATLRWSPIPVMIADPVAPMRDVTPSRSPLTAAIP